MGDDRVIAEMVEAAYLDSLSPYGRWLVRSGQGTAEEVYAWELDRREAQAAALGRARNPYGLKQSLGVALTSGLDGEPIDIRFL